MIRRSVDIDQPEARHSDRFFWNADPLEIKHRNGIAFLQSRRISQTGWRNPVAQAANRP